MIVLGCTGVASMAQTLQRKVNVPVINGLVAAVKMAEALVDMGLSHSKLTYRNPSMPEIRGYW